MSYNKRFDVEYKIEEIPTIIEYFDHIRDENQDSFTYFFYSYIEHIRASYERLFTSDKENPFYNSLHILVQTNIRLAFIELNRYHPELVLAWERKRKISKI